MTLLGSSEEKLKRKLDPVIQADKIRLDKTIAEIPKPVHPKRMVVYFMDKPNEEPKRIGELTKLSFVSILLKSTN
jgi:hypothetical protein